MKAVRRTAPGVAEVQQVAEPTSVGPDEVLVEMHFAAVNPIDAMILRGDVGADPDRVITLGSEGSGVVDGRRVQVSGGLGAGRDGTFAPLVVAPKASVRPLPDGADLALAATVGVAGKTAWRAIHQLARVGGDDVVLVLGAAGGVGTFAVQLARAAGARVLAQTGQASKSERLTALGAEPVVAETPTEVAEAVAGAGVTVVLDPLGGDYVASLLPIITPSSRVVTYGVLAGRTTTVDLGVLYGKGIKILGTSGGTTPPDESDAALEGALRAVLEGVVVVDYEVLSLDEGPAAFTRLKERTVAGKLLFGM